MSNGIKAVIMAGGKGTRIATVNSEVPKPMIEIDGKPILLYQIECLKKQNITDITLVIGHLGHIVRDYFADGSTFGVQIDYVVEEEPLGTAGALYFLRNKINEDFYLINGDIIFDIDTDLFMKHHKSLGGLATILTHPNAHPYDSAIIVANEEKRVTNWLHKEEKRIWYRNRVNAGIHILSPGIFQYFDELKKTDLDRDILKPLIPSGQLYIYDSPEYVKDMGTPDRYEEVLLDLRDGKVSAKNLLNRQRAVFIDRDGTLNEYVGFLKEIDDFMLIEGVEEAIRKINKLGYLAIVITNQPVIARGDVSLEELELIHNKMETQLGYKGAFLDAIYYCPHHPDKGFDGERIEYKIECECRKPKPGLLFEAAEEYNIDLGASWMVGDSSRDIEAGKAAGCNVSLINSESEAKSEYDSLLEFVNDKLC